MEGEPPGSHELRKSSTTRRGGWRQGFLLPWDDSRIPKKPSVKAREGLISLRKKLTVGKVPSDEITATRLQASQDRNAVTGALGSSLTWREYTSWSPTGPTRPLLPIIPGTRDLGSQRLTHSRQTDVATAVSILLLPYGKHTKPPRGRQ